MFPVLVVLEPRADLYLTLHRFPRDGRGKEASNEDRMNYDFCGMCAVDKGKITLSTKTVVVGLSQRSCILLAMQVGKIMLYLPSCNWDIKHLTLAKG